MSAQTWHTDLVAALKSNRIHLIAQVADRVLAPIVQLLESDGDVRVITLTREEEGIGILTGAYLGGTRGALLLQSSGFGNTLNALGSLAIPYQIPFPIILSPRGGLGEHNLVQVALGKAVPDIAAALGLQTFELRSPEDVSPVVNAGTRHSFVSRRPVILSISTSLSGGSGAR